MKNNGNVNINVNAPNGGENEKIGPFKWAAHTIAKAKWLSILKVYIVMFFFLGSFVAMYFLYNAASDKEIVRNTAKMMQDNTEKEENIRDFVVTPKIQHELEKLVYSLGADRAFIFELHNGKKNGTGLPFRFADMTYEIVNEDEKADKVAMGFQNIPLTLYKYPHFLQRQKFMMGTTEEIEVIDADFAGHIREIGGKYLGMIYLNSDGT